MRKQKVTPKKNETPTSDRETNLETSQKIEFFCWDGDVLHHVGKRKFYMGTAMSKMSLLLKRSFKKHIISYTRQGDYAPSSYECLFAALQSTLNVQPASTFDESWIACALESISFWRYKRGLFRFFLHWQERDSIAINQNALRLLNDTAPIKQRPSNVLSDDPEKSWLFDEEYDELLKFVWSNYKNAVSSTQITLIKLLSMQYSRRPIQIAYLKVGDVSEQNSSEKNGLTGRIIEFPGVKDPVAENSFRDSKFEPHPLSDELWSLYCIQRKEVKALYEYTLGILITNEQLAKLPLFCSQSRIKVAQQIIANHHLDLLENLEIELFHLPKNSIINILGWRTNSPSCNFSKDKQQRKLLPTAPISPRTGEVMVVSATRMRHTRVRQLARQGVPSHMLSNWLGHSSANGLDAYYNDPAEQARKIDEAMAPVLAPLAMAFTGTLIESEEQATMNSDPTSKLEFATDGELKGVGRCGKHSFCGTTSIPIPCYRCRYFEPLVDAPHHEVLRALTQRQSAENDVLKLGSQRSLLVPIDLSADIRAVTNCIARCKAHKSEREAK